eukprot:m.245811 g.245811  ORF g.245811 m.245811 type:complete len:61 (-) comp15368_c0_seq3:1005-1187(-)
MAVFLASGQVPLMCVCVHVCGHCCGQERTKKQTHKVVVKPCIRFELSEVSIQKTTAPSEP